MGGVCEVLSSKDGEGETFLQSEQHLLTVVSYIQRSEEMECGLPGYLHFLQVSASAVAAAAAAATADTNTNTVSATILHRQTLSFSTEWITRDFLRISEGFSTRLG